MFLDALCSYRATECLPQSSFIPHSWPRVPFSSPSQILSIARAQLSSSHVHSPQETVNVYLSAFPLVYKLHEFRNHGCFTSGSPGPIPVPGTQQALKYWLNVDF